MLVALDRLSAPERVKRTNAALDVRPVKTVSRRLRLWRPHPARPFIAGRASGAAHVHQHATMIVLRRAISHHVSRRATDFVGQTSVVAFGIECGARALTTGGINTTSR
ncbi:MAG TPA: hypothetical protein VF201_01205 [Nitrolancea sp.]